MLEDGIQRYKLALCIQRYHGHLANGFHYHWAFCNVLGDGLHNYLVLRKVSQIVLNASLLGSGFHIASNIPGISGILGVIASLNPRTL